MSDWQERPDPYLEALRRAPEAPHRNSWTGRPCRCPWGVRRAQNVRTAGQQVNKLLKAQDKAYRTPEGQGFREALADLVDRHPDADALAPFLAQRWKKGEIDYVDGRLFDRSGQIERELPQWTEWYHAKQHPSRRGVNIMAPDFTVDDLRAKVNEHQASIERERAVQEDLGHGDVVHKWDDGWHVRHLTAPGTDVGEALYQEGRHMNHCIGDGAQPYIDLARNGQIEVYSLRDPKGFPHGTWHLNSDGSVAEVNGNADNRLSPEQDEKYQDWCQSNGVYSEPVGNQEHAYDQEITLADPDDVPSYLDQYSDSGGNWEEYMPPNATWGEDTQVNMGDPQYSAIAQHLYTSQDPTKPRQWYEGNPEVQREVFDTAMNALHLPELHSEMMSYPIDDPWEQDIQDRWQRQYNEHVHPLTGEFTQPRWNQEQGRYQPITDLFQPRMFQPDWTQTDWSRSQPPRGQNAWENTPGWTYSRRRHARPWDDWGQWQSPPTPAAQDDTDPWYYHASPRRNRDSIQREGLRPPGEGMTREDWFGDDPYYPEHNGDPGQPPDYETDRDLELYATDHPSGAHAFMGSGQPYDVWAFQVPKDHDSWGPHDYMQGYDYENNKPYTVKTPEGKDIWAYTGVVRVPPEQLVLHTPWEQNPRNQEERVAHVPEDHKHRDTDLYSATDYLEDNRYRRRVTS